MSWECASCSGANPDGMRFCGFCGAPQRALRDERRLVTALFADISGFSELTNRLGPEQLLEVIDPVVAALSNVVGRYEGVIEKFAGDALMALFGAPVAQDDDAARALHVAIDMHAELARIVPHLPAAAQGLRLHAGVNSGHGIGRVIGSEVRFDYGVLGDVVVLAQRLEAAAPSGETYVGETTYQLTRKDFDFEALGELSVKGKDKPVAAWRLIGPHARLAGVPDGKGAAAVLVGRQSEMAAMNGFVARLDEGLGGAVFVLGEPGMGKTSLCEAMAARAAASQWEWLEARCLSYGGELAYWPFADLMRRLLGIVDVASDAALDVLRAALASRGLDDTLPFIGTLCGVPGAPTVQLTPQAFQTRLHESVVAILLAGAAQRPVVLHLDDLQWADGPTVALVGDVVTAAVSAPLALLASARPSASVTVDDLVARSGGSSVRLDLQPLGADAVREIATRILGTPPGPGLATALLDHTRGNPFFVEEVTRALVERGALVARGGEWHTVAGWDGEQVPLTVEGVVAARIDALSDDERGALEILSVIGRRADLLLARAVAGGIDATLPALVAAGLLDPVDGDTGRYMSFHHPLTHQVVYSRLLRRRRASLHRSVGETAEALLGADDSSVDLLARHFYVGEGYAKAFQYVLRAAARAERLFANDQAITYLRQALDIEEQATGATVQRPALLLRCAQLEEVRGSYDAALAVYDEVLDTTGDVRAVLGKASTLRKLGEYERSIATIAAARAAHESLTAEQSAALALEEGSGQSMIGDLRGAAETLNAGLALLDDRNARLQGQILIMLARVEQFAGASAGALDHAEQARRAFEAEEDLHLLATALRVLGGLQHDFANDADLDAIRGARETLEEALALARRIGNAEEAAASLVNLGLVLWSLGMTEDALRCDRESIEAFESVGLKAGVACGYCNLAEHLGLKQRWEESMAAALQGLTVATEIGHSTWISGALIGIADAAMAQGEYARAAEAAEEAAERALAAGYRDRAQSALVRAVEAHRRLGDDARAEQLLRQVPADPAP
ncbi:MAG TPA: adenylate/guanylate cyclase domain-containing protein [Candidatus Dormibacteraeota bacterium]|jgi:class 3 adenylate cyclase/predicted ATPase|nr:adenylate/guanylate cyclase domain-containing protein [Candidatus Dormibacteraeota bacterium]